MKKLVLGLGFIILLVLSACSEFNTSESNEVSLNEEEKVVLQDTIAEMKELNQNQKYSSVIWLINAVNYENEDSNILRDSELRKEYNIAVNELFNKGMNEFYSNNGEVLIYELLDEETNTYITEETNKKMQSIKDKIVKVENTNSIDGFTSILKELEGLEKVDEEMNVLKAYSNYRIAEIKESKRDNPYYEYVNDFKLEIGSMAKVTPPSYSGMFASQIKDVILSKMQSEEWAFEYTNNNEIPIREIEIGMTQLEVIDLTTWGRPKEINKNTNSSGVSEQWVYDDFKYLYFEDGILTSIQE